LISSIEEVVHLDVEGFHLVGEIVVSPDSGDGDEQAEGGVTSASEIPPATAERPVALFAAMP